MSPSPLTELPLFADCRAEEVASLATIMATRRLAAGERLMVQGEDSRFFAVVVSGELRVTRNEGDGIRELAVAGPGAILGEIGLLARRSRIGTVTATTDAEVLTGDAEVFEHLLGLPGVTDRVWRLASIRLAEDVRPVPVSLPDGTPVLLRPLLPSDRATLADAVRRVSAETLRRRFFEGGVPSNRTIDYLVNINYVDHFAWAVVDGTEPAEGLAVARYVRLRDDPATAEVAFTVMDDFQGRGIGTLLLGAVAAPASLAGIERFSATMLADNTGMRKVFAKAHATITTGEPGQLAVELPVDAALATLEGDLRARLLAAVRDVVTFQP